MLKQTERAKLLMTKDIFVSEQPIEPEQPQAISDNSTFKILLLVVGLLCIIVGVLLLANTFVTRKNLRSATQDRDLLRLARI